MYSEALRVLQLYGIILLSYCHCSYQIIGIVKLSCVKLFQVYLFLTPQQKLHCQKRSIYDFFQRVLTNYLYLVANVTPSFYFHILSCMTTQCKCRQVQILLQGFTMLLLHNKYCLILDETDLNKVFQVRKLNHGQMEFNSLRCSKVSCKTGEMSML